MENYNTYNWLNFTFTVNLIFITISLSVYEHECVIAISLLLCFLVVCFIFHITWNIKRCV